MTIDTVQPAPVVPAAYPRQDAKGQPGREAPQRDGKAKPAAQEPQEQDLFLNSLGQLTGQTINVTA